MTRTSNCVKLTLLLSLVLAPALVAADWLVQIDGVFGQSIDFSTGNEPGATMKIELYDVCRVDSATRQDMGELYPANQVLGLNMDATAIANNPGCCNKISYTFEPFINETSLFSDNFDGTGTVAFCAQVSLYDGGTLVNLAEVRVEYTMNTQTGEAWLQSHTITDAAGFTDAEDSGLWFDGSLQAYFCDPNSHTLMDYGVIGQGTIMSICFQVPDGQFEIKDVVDLTVHGADGYGPSQPIISGSSIVADTIGLKSCYDNGDSDTNICIVQLLLKPEFFETSAVTLTGTGTVLLELGDSNNRKLLKQPARASLPASGAVSPIQRRIEASKVGDFITSPYQVKASRFFITPGNRHPATKGNSQLPSLSSSATISNILSAAIIFVCMLLCCVSTCFIAHKCTSRGDEDDEPTRQEGKACALSATEFMMEASGQIESSKACNFGMDQSVKAFEQSAPNSKPRRQEQASNLATSNKLRESESNQSKSPPKGAKLVLDV